MNSDVAYLESALCCLLEVDKLLCNPHSLIVVSKNGTSITLQPDQTDRSEILTAAGRFMASSTDYLWLYSDDQDGLLWEVEENHSLSCNLEIREADQAAVKPVLVIGRHVLTEGGVICINEVLSVDVLRSAISGDFLYFCALVRCRTGGHDSTTTVSLLYVTVDEEIPRVHCTCSLVDVLLFDQTPTNVRYIAPNTAVVHGTNGLLCLVSCGASGNAVTHLLVDDNMRIDNHECVLSHRGDATITTVDYVLNMGVDGCDITIGSGDSEGTVCMWRVNSDTGTGYLLHQPYRVECETRRIVSLHLSPSGCEVAVGLCDRLFLLHYSELCSATEECEPTCDSVDMWDTSPVLYGVFVDEDCLRVWRVVDQLNNASPGIAVTTWSHRYTRSDDYTDINNDALVVSNVEVGTYIADSLLLVEAVAIAVDPASPVTALQLLPAVAESNLSVDTDVIIDHHARHASHFAAFGMFRPESPSEQRVKQNTLHLRRMIEWYKQEHLPEFLHVKPVLAVLNALQERPSVEFLAAVLSCSVDNLVAVLCTDMQHIIDIRMVEDTRIVQINHPYTELLTWLCSTESNRIGAQFWIDPAVGHNLVAALYLTSTTKHLEESVALYLQTYGAYHLQHASRGLRLLTS